VRAIRTAAFAARIAAVIAAPNPAGIAARILPIDGQQWHF
jgi:hypothetical protein